MMALPQTPARTRKADKSNRKNCDDCDVARRKAQRANSAPEEVAIDPIFSKRAVDLGGPKSQVQR